MPSMLRVVVPVTSPPMVTRQLRQRRRASIACTCVASTGTSGRACSRRSPRSTVSTSRPATPAPPPPVTSTPSSSSASATTTPAPAGARASPRRSACSSPTPRSPSASHLVMVSSAMVYGAFSNNPVPITEESVLRPDPEFVFARQLASAEELVEEWRRGADGRSVTVLRPALAMAEDGTSSLVRALAAGLGHRFGEDDPVAQFVHLDDVASAVALSVERRLDGVYNVAPDGWIPGERVRALTGDRLRFPLPERLREVVGALRWRFQRGPIPPGLEPVHTRAVGGRQRQAAIGRMDADRHQRADLRRGHRGEVVDDGDAEAPSGALARSDGRRDRRRCRSWGSVLFGGGCVADELADRSEVGVAAVVVLDAHADHVAVVVDHRRAVGGLDLLDVTRTPPASADRRARSRHRRRAACRSATSRP